MKSLRKQSRRYISIVLFLGAFLAIQFWQTRSLPHGIAPIIVATDLQSGIRKTLPTQSKDVEILYFFAPWCGVCKLSSQNAEIVTHWIPGVRVTFVGLDYETRDEVLQFVAENHLSSDVVLAGPQTRRDWNIDAYPTAAVINHRGEISSLSVGYSTVVGTYIRVLLAKLGV